MTAAVPIIDTHVHLWDFKHPELKWDWLKPNSVHPILGEINAIKSEQFTLEDLWSEARFAGIEAFVHIQAAIGSPDPVTETRWLTEMANSGPVPLRIIGDCSLGSDGAMQELERHCESQLFVGIRDFNAEPMLATGITNSIYEESLEFLSKNSLVFDLDCEWMNMPAALEMAKRHSDLKIVLEHIGFPRHRDDDYFSNWKKGAHTLAQAPNVTMKISGLGMTDRKFTEESLRRWVEVSLEAFGPDRCVLGSNWPVDRLFSSYDVIMGFEREYISALSISEQALICNENAKKLYNF